MMVRWTTRLLLHVGRCVVVGLLHVAMIIEGFTASGELLAWISSDCLDCMMASSDRVS